MATARLLDFLASASPTFPAYRTLLPTVMTLSLFLSEEILLVLMLPRWKVMLLSLEISMSRVMDPVTGSVLVQVLSSSPTAAVTASLSVETSTLTKPSRSSTRTQPCFVILFTSEVPPTSVIGRPTVPSVTSLLMTCLSITSSRMSSTGSPNTGRPSPPLVLLPMLSRLLSLLAGVMISKFLPSTKDLSKLLALPLTSSAKAVRIRPSSSTFWAKETST